LSKRHPKKDIRPAIEFALSKGWRLEKSTGKGHTWAKLYCPNSDQSGCIVYVYCTPKNDVNHARQIIRKVEKCHCGSSEDEQDL